jgi:uncharacterized protein (TIGR00297 family)
VIERTIAGAVLATLVAGVGWRARALTGAGAVLAACVGTLAVAAGWRWGILLILFFVASSGLSRVGSGRKAAQMRGIVAKAGARDTRQVMANGGVFAAAAAGSLIWPHEAWSAAALGALAAVTADTWGTEIGGLARGAPRLITTWREVPPGTSGAVSIAGVVATVLGAAFIATCAALLGWGVGQAAAALVGGVAGAIADSLVGASVQERRRCTACAMDTEQRIHLCGATTVVIGGLVWLENDAVNLLSSAVGAAVALTLAT